MDLDPDGDGQSSRGEYFAGTDPYDPSSHLKIAISHDSPLFILDWESQLDARYQLLESDNLETFAPLDDLLIGTAEPMRFEIDPDQVGGAEGRHFFSLSVLAPLDRDGDGLSDREEALLGTDPDEKNTDHDSYDDGEEVLSTFTDPLIFDPAGGAIRGSLRLVDSLTGSFETGESLIGKIVFIDSNFNGQLDEGERRTTTNETGAYEFLDLPPALYEVRQVLKSGETQTLPVEQTPQLPDRLPDEVVNYTHPESGAAMDVPYGWASREVWAGAEGNNIFPRYIEPVGPELLLKPIGVRVQNPVIGSFPTSEHLVIPDTGSATVRFNETIIDKDGPDFIIGIPAQGVGGPAAGEPALIAFGPSLDELSEFPVATVFPEGVRGINLVDLADYPEIPFVKFIRVTSQTNGMVTPQNADGGFGLAGFEALNFLALNSEARRIHITGTEVFEDENFARYFQDLPPSLFLSPQGNEAQAGQPFPFRLIATDDLGIASVTTTANGSVVILSSELFGTFTPAFPGELVITATVTDTSGQSTTGHWTHFVRDENGDLPYDSETLAEQQGGGFTRIQVFSPNTGDVPTEDAPILASIVAPVSETPNWSISYAPIDLVDLQDLFTPDPDFVLLASGTDNVYSSPLATFPATSLAHGIYFLKIEAIPSRGGVGNIYGQVIGVGVDPAALSPQIQITSPEDGATSSLVQDIRGSIISERPLTSWELAYAPLDEVDLSNLGNGMAWKTIASGTETIDEDILASLDTSFLINGRYIVRVTAYNDLRLGRVEGIQLEVSSPAKPGRLRRLFTDLSLELHGLPLKIDRVYDSLERENVGDFGHGWGLDIADANILETVPDTGANFFGATAYRQGTRVYLNTPDGQRVGFTFEAEFAAGGLIGSVYRAKFIPDTGNRYKLETPEGDEPFLSLKPNGEVTLTFISLPWNPDRFILTSPDGIAYSYHEKQGLTGIEDLNGNTLEYSKSGITHSAGPGVVFTRDSKGRITSITGPGGEIWAYAYSTEGDLASVTDPVGNVTTFGYDLINPHFLTTVTDPFGRIGITFEYDADGRLSAVIDEFGNREEQTWDPAALTGTITNRNGHVTSVIYDERGNVLTATDPLGNVTTFKYDDPRHPDAETEIITENTRVRYVLNELGLPTGVQYGDGIFTDFRTIYNERGQVTEQTSFGNEVEKRTYDNKGNLLTRRGLLPYIWEERSYTPEGQIASETINGRSLETFYDPTSGMKANETGPFNLTRQFSYSLDGSLSTVTDARGEKITFDFESDQNKVSVILPGGAAVTASFDSAGNLIRSDANGNSATVELAYNDAELNRILQDGSKIEREFDPEGNMTKITVPGGHENTFGYDALNRKTSFTDAAGETSTTVCDAEGRTVSLTNRNGKKISYTYNRFSLIETENWHAPDDSIERTFTYSYSTSRLDYVTDGSSTWTLVGALEQSKPSAFKFEYEGQSEFDLTTDWTTFRQEAIPNRIRIDQDGDSSYESEISADFIGNRAVGMKYFLPDLSDGSVRLGFDPDGRATEIGRFDFFQSALYSIEPVSRTRMTYNPAGDLASIRHEKSDASLLFPEGELTFARDPGGRITTRTQAGNVSSYSYDALDQITAVTHSGFTEETFAYDLAGNPVSATTGADNRLLTLRDLTFTYDAEGNVATQTNTTNTEVRTFSYDHRNQLIAVTATTSGNLTPVTLAEYKYDYKGRMMYRIENGQKTWILYERDIPHAEFTDGSTDLSRIYLYNFDKPDEVYGSWTPTEGIRWHLTDQVGSIQGIVASDGSAVHWLEYDTFGQPRTTVPADFGPLRFAGRHYNSAIGLYENQLRHYNPEIRRFQQQDPIRHESQDFNYYRYAENNPLSKSDPLGTSAATEYGQLLKSLVNCAKSAKAIGDCVNQLLAGAAVGLQGKTAKIDVRCGGPGSYNVAKSCAAAGP